MENKETIINRNQSFYQVDTATRQQQVINILAKYGRSTNSEIAKLMNQPINRITGRVNELVKSGKVIIDGSKKDTETNRTVTVFKLPDQLELF